MMMRLCRANKRGVLSPARPSRSQTADPQPQVWGSELKDIRKKYNLTRELVADALKGRPACSHNRTFNMFTFQGSEPSYAKDIRQKDYKRPSIRSRYAGQHLHLLEVKCQLEKQLIKRCI